MDRLHNISRRTRWLGPDLEDQIGLLQLKIVLPSGFLEAQIVLVETKFTKPFPVDDSVPHSFYIPWWSRDSFD